MQNKKLKILALSDHALSTSGVGTQSRHLFNGLVSKGNWSIRQFGAALKHSDYRTVVVNDDLIIKPIDGFGNPDMLRVALASEKPDILFIFTDPRFFTWLFDMEDEIHQICPIVWWHVWDNYPYPAFNEWMYKATDLLNCHSHMTYTMLKETKKYGKKLNFIPHTLPAEVFSPLPDKEVQKAKTQLLGAERKDDFVGIWINRNAKRKRPNDVLESWKLFLESLYKEKGHKNATLIMHTDPNDHEGPNLLKTSEMLGLENNVVFSRDRLDFDQMNILYNISDFCINISFAEGFGLGTLESMMTGTPIIATKTGGMIRQVIDHRDGSENGVGLNVESQTMVGSQGVPYIYEDYVSCQTISEGIMKLYRLTQSEKTVLREKVLNYAREEFSHKNMINEWNDTLLDVHTNWKKDYKRWEKITL
jgi:glycosyltransferase involved in cell wall biosynthesis